MSHILIFMFLAISMLFPQQEKQPSCPMHEKHAQAAQDATDEQHRGVDERGDVVMGFSHEKTTHHFFLYADGGAIDVEAKDANDTESRDQIRMHLAHFSRLFAEGNFTGPMFIHAENVPGTAVMKELREEIRYQVEPTERGGRMRITAANAKALAAVHEFLRFQIRDHRTGDPEKVTPPPAQHRPGV